MEKSSSTRECFNIIRKHTSRRVTLLSSGITSFSLISTRLEFFVICKLKSCDCLSIQKESIMDGDPTPKPEILRNRESVCRHSRSPRRDSCRTAQEKEQIFD